MPKTSVTFKLEKEDKEMLDDYVERSGFKDRSEILRYLVEQLLIQRNVKRYANKDK